MGSGFLDIIFFAALAVYVGYKLFSVLGRKDYDPDSEMFNKEKSIFGEDEKDLESNNNDKDIEAESWNVVSEEIEEWMIPHLESIRKYDREFTITEFIDGAKKAFEMIIDAFAKGNTGLLEKLLSKDLFLKFESEIAKRVALGEVHETTLVSLQEVKVKNIQTKAAETEIVVEFISEQVNLVKNGKGEIIDGDPSDIENITEQWTFRRDVSSSNPNWKLVATLA